MGKGFPVEQPRTTEGNLNQENGGILQNEYVHTVMNIIFIADMHPFQ